MNKPSAEPEGGKKAGHNEVSITLLSNSGKPWDGSVIEHNGKKYRVNKDGESRLAINGGEIRANGHAITHIIRQQIQQGASDIVLQHNAWTGSIKLQQS